MAPAPIKAVVRADPVPQPRTTPPLRGKTWKRTIGLRLFIALSVATLIVMYEDRLSELFERLIR